MSATPVSILDAGDEPRAIPTVVSAFAADPVERWLYPADEEYERHFPEFVAAFGGRAFAGGTAWALEGGAAVALWLAPGVEPGAYRVARVFGEAVDPEKQEELFAVPEQMGEAHPLERHWYLPWLAVEPERQSGGLGGRLLAHCLEIVDESGLPAFLETPNPRNVGFYERHGFEVVAMTGRTAR
jgi:ribosomal protein S18 acetylase RimI-like enzyme